MHPWTSATAKWVKLGFTKDYGTRDAIFTLLSVVRRYKRNGLHAVFVDFRGAFDSVDRAKLIRKLKSMNIIDDAWINFVDCMHRNVKGSVSGSRTSFDENVGVKQGDPLGPLLFILFINDLHKYIAACELPQMASLASRIIRCLLYADDLVLMSHTESGLQRQLDALQHFCSLHGLHVSIDKTKHMIFHNDRAGVMTKRPLQYGGEVIKQVDSFKYLGITVDRRGSCDMHIASVISAYRKSMFACIDRVLRLSASCPLHIKTMIFLAYAKPVLLYFAAVLEYTTHQLNHIDKITLQYARWCLGLRSKTSSRLYTLYEVGLRPFFYDIIEARINFFTHLRGRRQGHYTSAALDEMFSARGSELKRLWYDPMTTVVTQWGGLNFLKILYTIVASL